MRQIIFENGDVLDVSETSNSVSASVEGLTFAEASALIQKYADHDWSSFDFKRVTERDEKVFHYENRKLDHFELFPANDAFTLRFAIAELTEAEIYKQALEIMMGGAE